MSSSMTPEEKELLADRIVALLKADDPRAELAELARKVNAGEEGEDGLNSVVLAVATAMLEHLSR